MEAIRRRKTKVQSWYLDVTMLAQYWGQERVYHHTAPINMTYGLYEALRLVPKKGLDAAFARHALNHAALEAGLAAIGIRFTAQEGHQLPMLNAVRIPDGVDDAAVRSGLLERFGIEIGGGLGEFKGKVWRIGLMGHGSRMQNVLVLLAALEELLAEQGHPLRGRRLDRRGESRLRQAVTHKDTKPKRQRYPRKPRNLEAAGLNLPAFRLRTTGSPRPLAISAPSFR